MIWQTVSTSSANTEQIGHELGMRCKGGEVIELVSDLGGGKTTFVRGLAAGIGSTDAVASPSFTLSREYKAADKTLYHFDFYRLKDQSEAMDMGYEEYFYSGNYCFIEWPEKIADLLPDSYTGVHIKVINAHSRQITVENIS